VVGPSGISTAGSGTASSPTGTIFHAALDDGPLYTVDRTTGAATPVGTLTGTDSLEINSLSFDGAGALYGSWLDYGSTGPRPSRLITINTTTAALTFLGPSVNRLDATVFVTSTRTLSFGASKVKARKAAAPTLKVTQGQRVRFSGDLTVPQYLTDCESNQTVEVQRKKPKKKSFITFLRVQTDNAGKFSIKRKVKKTFVYRAVVGESAVCDDAASKRQKVKTEKS
jgi:hypothetical protein